MFDVNSWWEMFDLLLKFSFFLPCYMSSSSYCLLGREKKKKRREKIKALSVHSLFSSRRRKIELSTTKKQKEKERKKKKKKKQKNTRAIMLSASNGSSEMCFRGTPSTITEENIKDQLGTFTVMISDMLLRLLSRAFLSRGYGICAVCVSVLATGEATMQHTGFGDSHKALIHTT